MAMNPTNLKSEMKTAILAAVAADYANISDDQTLTGFTLPEYLEKYLGALASAIYTHITTNARATGTDSRGDTHDLTIV